MSYKTTVTVNYNIPIEVEWVCSKCGNQNNVSQIVQIQGDANSRSPFVNQDKLHSEASNEAFDGVDTWIQEIQKSGATRKYSESRLNCKCAKCDNRECWSSNWTSISQKIGCFTGGLVVIGIIALLGLICGTWECIFFMIPGIVGIITCIILSKCFANKTNKLTQKLDVSSLPIVKYNGNIISCPQKVEIDSLSPFEMSLQIHNEDINKVDALITNYAKCQDMDSLVDSEGVKNEIVKETNDNSINNENVENSFKSVYYCHKCGTQIFDDSLFCHKCGSNIKYRK